MKIGALLPAAPLPSKSLSSFSPLSSPDQRTDLRSERKEKEEERQRKKKKRRRRRRRRSRRRRSRRLSGYLDRIGEEARAIGINRLRLNCFHFFYNLLFNALMHHLDRLIKYCHVCQIPVPINNLGRYPFEINPIGINLE